MLIALLAAFQQVVSAGVAGGEARRLAARTQADSVWRCNALHSRSPRDECLRTVASSTAGSRP
jgi:hypothetical protein